MQSPVKFPLPSEYIVSLDFPIFMEFISFKTVAYKRKDKFVVSEDRLGNGKCVGYTRMDSP